METVAIIDLMGEKIEINTNTVFPVILADVMYEGDIDLMMADLKSKEKLMTESKKIKKISEKIPGISSNFVTKPFIFSEFLSYLKEFELSPSDFNHATLNELYDIILDYADHHEFDDLKSIIKFMIEIDPNYTPAYEILGSVLIEEGNLEEGKKYLELAVKQDPWNVAALSELGETYFNLGEYEKAAEIWMKEVELMPENTVTYFMISDAYRQCGNFKKAARILEKFLNKYPKSILAKYELMEVYKKLERSIEANELKAEISRSQPEYVSDVEIWAKIMFQNEKYEKVERFINKFLDRNNEYEHFKILLVVPLLKSGKTEEAKLIIREIKEKFPWYYYGMKNILEDILDENEKTVLVD
ncbi:Tetratricopeptide repeat-containing protein [Marinitoga hydrogenitolerans DSM 16785]|uniref:Tetratricopeptide repeat-containing protein n=1 Tax=Marinitoga hydrogenitolerans (strain DSM 16785 / JCM 12826 / AT1271) TaxID=1122195 RepID=A0A1M4S633_MARH1|nr:tetratricopeptide repeat protein [Marinitoga hydrogenitolerans]SHE27641.1 Tetratricopeptide repeat-containing protein [Marinitoga hydrogenitolerans DSM 16785]